MTSSPSTSSCSTSESERPGLIGRAPVHQPLAAIDQALVVPADERLADGSGQPFVHREPLARPVQGVPHPLDLVDDLAAVLLLPLPTRARRTPRGRCRAGRCLPSRSSRSTTTCVAMPAWSMPGSQSVSYPCIRARRTSMSCERMLERVADVQAAGDVRRRDHDAVRLAFRREMRLEVAALDPLRRPPWLDRRRVVLRRHVLHGRLGGRHAPESTKPLQRRRCGSVRRLRLDDREVPSYVPGRPAEGALRGQTDPVPLGPRGSAMSSSACVTA